MLFLDPWFWVFALVALPGFWLCPRRVKLYWLLAASLVFHAHFAGPAGMVPILFLALVTYGAGRALAPGAERRGVFAPVIVLLVGALAFYKYSELGAETLGGLWTGIRSDDVPGPLTDWVAPAAPLAISFFTFEFVHYLYEVRVGGRAPVRNPFHFAVFAVFFPTLASGPIKRFPDFVPQLANLSNPRFAEVGAGARRVIRGLAKKILVADLIVAYVVELETQPEFTAAGVGLLAILQGLRIYYDFAGYSDIAIGLARMLGLRVPENFDRPYFSTSLQDFWRRWHISLSTWIRDYVYVPLGGNRVRRAANLVLAMAICGLWHGAAWHFALWGLYHGVGLAAEGLVRRRRPDLFEAGRGRALLRWAVCYVYVHVGWLLFFYPVDVVARMLREALG